MININEKDRKLDKSDIIIGYVGENKAESIQFSIPEYLKDYSKKICFQTEDGFTFSKNFDDINSNIFTFTRDITKYRELWATINFFKIENEDEIIYKTSKLHILFRNSVICDDDVSPDDPKVIVLDKLIEEVTKVGLEVEKKGDYANLQGDYAKEQGNYAKSQGDYAKEQKIEVVKANEEANKIINDFETNVREYTTAFNENANNKTTDFDSNVESKTSYFNQNVDNKISEYNNNASEKLSAYNTNAENRKNEFDTNVVNQTKTFNDNANSKLESYNQNDTTKKNAFNDNATTKTNAFNSNANFKTETYNNNHTEKLNAYNTNASTKLQEYNTNADNKIAEYDEHSQELDNKIVSTRNELERVKNDILDTGTASDTFIHLEDSAMAEFQELSVDGVCKQVTTSIDNGDEYDSPSPDYPQEIKTIENSLKITSCNKNLFDMDYVKGSVYGSYTITNNIITFIPSETSVSSRIIILIPKDKFISGQKYTIKANGCNRIAVGYATSVNDTSNYLYFGNKSNVNNISFTYSNVPTDYVCIYLYNTNSTLGTNWALSEIQLEEGDQPTPYEQHLETQITANLPEGEFIGKINDTYKDTLKVEYNEEDGKYHLYLDKVVGKVVFDGSTDENWNTYTSNSGDKVYATYINDYKKTSGITCMCDKFIPTNNYGYGVLVNGQCNLRNANDTYNLFYACTNNFSTIAEFKTWLASNNVTVYFVLAEPYEVDLGIVDTLLSYDEVTNVFTDSDLLPQINAKYYRNFKSTIQNLQVNEKALKQELVDINNRLSALESANVSVTSESEVVE